MQLNEKVALITGGDSGIGRAIALCFAGEGARVAISYAHAAEKAAEVKQLIEQAGGQVLVVQADVAQYQQALALVEQTVEHYGRLDILVNNAGMEIHRPFVDVSEEEFDRVLAVDLKGAFFCAQAAARQMIRQGSAGRIINISSVHEDLPMPLNVPYCCAKGGLRMLTRTICLELAPHQITVNNIAPGAIDTPIDADVKADPQKYQALLAEIPLHRMGQPEEVAALALYLASDAAAYVTGATFVIDGGLMRNTGSL
ncbi:SDR family oxidoreductase [Thermogemmatispora tikiterensis]|uniref:Sugar dehydrogenase n=1 Tax=Thermogemmatispora tikiterensis TaxID=1825093 RepID=A0A328VHY4_9CHLR|nr:SDR family oxidoreductase [Thermogemmatispora tikiterensis]RAQ95702.1 sugar dehydrogenase [Thermogemmatispora tikiterensis]